MDDSDLSKMAKAVSLGKAAIETVVGIVKSIPSSTERETARMTLEKAQRDLQASEAGAAEALGHVLCHCDWPTMICIQLPTGDWFCKRCKKTIRFGAV